MPPKGKIELRWDRLDPETFFFNERFLYRVTREAPLLTSRRRSEAEKPQLPARRNVRDRLQVRSATIAHGLQKAQDLRAAAALSRRSRRDSGAAETKGRGPSPLPTPPYNTTA